jgi:hypothetical protein
MIDGEGRNRYHNCMTMHGSVSHDRREETPEAKARWFRSLPMSERMEMLCAFTDLALSLNPSLQERKYAEPVAGRVQVLSPAEIDMPEISRFLGIVIAMYFKEHAPPHFHAKYGGQRAAFSIQDLRLIEGKLPHRVTSLVLEWAFQHREELMEDWARAERREDLQKIEPLV